MPADRAVDAAVVGEDERAGEADTERMKHAVYAAR